MVNFVAGVLTKAYSCELRAFLNEKLQLSWGKTHTASYSDIFMLPCSECSHVDSHVKNFHEHLTLIINGV